MKKHRLLISLLLATLVSCASLAPSAANIAYKAYAKGDYQQALLKVNSALARYDYPVEEKANLLFLKAESYAKLKQTTDAMGVLYYLKKQYPETEAAYRANTMIDTIKKMTKKKRNQPAKKPKRPVISNI